jgi:hypothetical protein
MLLQFISQIDQLEYNFHLYDSYIHIKVIYIYIYIMYTYVYVGVWV